MQQFETSSIRKVIVTNTIPTSAYPDGIGTQIEQLSIAQILADAIKRITANRSVSELFASDDLLEGAAEDRPPKKLRARPKAPKRRDRGSGLRNQQPMARIPNASPA